MLGNFIEFPNEKFFKKKGPNSNEILNNTTETLDPKLSPEHIQKTKKKDYGDLITKLLLSVQKEESSCDPSMYWNDLQTSVVVNAPPIFPNSWFPTYDLHEDDIYTNLLKINGSVSNNETDGSVYKCPRVSIPFQTLVKHWNCILENSCESHVKKQHKNYSTARSEATKSRSEKTIHLKNSDVPATVQKTNKNQKTENCSSPLALSSRSTHLPTFRSAETSSDQDCDFLKVGSSRREKKQKHDSNDIALVSDESNAYIEEAYSFTDNRGDSKEKCYNFLVNKLNKEFPKNQSFFNNRYETSMRNASYQRYKDHGPPTLRRGASESNILKKKSPCKRIDKDKIVRSPKYELISDENKIHVPEFLRVELKKTGRLNLLTSDKSVRLEMISVLMRQNLENPASNYVPVNDSLLKPSVAKTFFEERLKTLKEQRNNCLQPKKD